MGGLVKAVTKPFEVVGKAVKGVVGAVTGAGESSSSSTTTTTPSAPTIIQNPGAATQASTGTSTPTSDTDSGESSERSARRGKKSLTIRRSNVGGGSGLNV